MAQIDVDALAENPECRTLYRAVCIDPVSDGPRVRLADWLTAHGHPIGEYIAERIEGGKREHLSLFRMNRGYELLKGLGSRDIESLADHEYLRLTMRRGFYDKVETDQTTFLKHAAELFQNYPLTEVVLTLPWGKPIELENKSCVLAYGVNGYFDGGRDHAPSLDLRIAHNLVGYNVTRRSMLMDSDQWFHGYSDPARAHLAISEACISHGREVAGLPMMRIAKNVTIISGVWRPRELAEALTPAGK